MTRSLGCVSAAVVAALTVGCGGRQDGGGGTSWGSSAGSHSSGADDSGDEGGGASEGSSGGSGGGSSGSGGSGSSGSEGGPTTGSTGSGGTAGTSAEGGGPRFDVGTGDTEGASGEEGPPGEGCQKVDFLFVIDSSGSMQDEQQNLITSFPGFITAIQNTLQAKDYHILVADTDAQSNGQICTTLCAFFPDCNGTPCSMIPPPAAAGPCDTTLGGGHVNDLNGVACGVVGAQRYLVDGQPDLNGVFGCLAEVGTLGDGNEQQAGTAAAAVSPALVGPGGCNEGFVRDDAILVVTIITDEEDGPNDGDPDTSSAGNPTTWKQALLDAKRGDEGAVVVLGLIGDGDIGGTCPASGLMNNTGAEPAPNLRTFVESFMYGSTGSVCAPDYAPFFEQAISVIDTACDEYVPPG